MIVFGAIVPHPPILLPEIGQGRESSARSTLAAYESVARRLRELNVQRALLISTHGVVTLGRFHVLSAEQEHLTGDFERFGQATLGFTCRVDVELTRMLLDTARIRGIPLSPTALWERGDHSLGVPIRLLGEALPSALGVVSISFRPAREHYEFGRAIGESLARIAAPTAAIASGDAVHTLSAQSPYGCHPRAAEVQEAVESGLASWDHEALIGLDEGLRHAVDESVISPALILMGAMRHGRASTLVSEHPWGVGYVTAMVERDSVAECGAAKW